MSTETAIGGYRYRIGRLDVFRQFHVARRLAPILSAMASTFKPTGKKLDMARIIAAVSEAMGKLSEEDADYILKTCLTVVERQVASEVDQYAPVFVSGMMMFADIELPQMLDLTLQVIQENLLRFFPASLSGLTRSGRSRA